ncbi:MAG: class A beta-lactamase-related serine hydrolase [Chloroflexi bacterium]|nr:class A beta-lactamase-related serine hydrolase [Chloroflexota bacterium]
MTLSDYRTREFRFPIIFALSILIFVTAAFLFVLEYRDYLRLSSEPPPDIMMGSVQVGGLDEEARLRRLEEVYLNQPVYLRYNGLPIWLSPRRVNFELDVIHMEDGVGSQQGDFWGGFMDHLQGQSQPPIRVELSASFSEAELRAYLEELAARYDAPPQGPDIDLVNLTFNRGVGDTRIDIEAALPLISVALMDGRAEARSVELPAITVQGQVPTMDTLRQSYLDFFSSRGIDYDGPDSVISIFVMDLESGQEMGIQENVRHTAASTIKLPVLINYYRHRIIEPPDGEKELLASSVICSQNSAANLLMEITSDDGSYSDGPRNTTETVCEAGAGNTSILSSLYVGTYDELRQQGFNPEVFYAPAAPLVCPSARFSETPAPEIPFDTQNYSTAADMGTLLMLTYDCANHDSGLRTVFPDEITQNECRQILEIMRGTRFFHMSELGVPEDVEMAHKVAYDGVTTDADISIVYSPGGDYIFTVYVWQRDIDGDGFKGNENWYLIGDLARIAYNFFNPDAPLLQTRTPLHPAGAGSECVLPRQPEDINLNAIDENRFDTNGDPVPGTCYGYPTCRPFDNWGLNP